MAFKPPTSKAAVPDTPDQLFRTLPRRKFPTEMPHQRAIMRAYVDQALDKSDVALQLPTGSGKTLVGLLIAEWRRLKFNERVVYLCPTKQLVFQTKEQAEGKYGLNVLAFTGSKHDYEPADAARYRQSERIAVTTYSSLFNTAPFFKDADCIIIDDAHAAENYVSAMWSLRVDAKTHKTLHAALAACLRPHISTLDHSRLMGDWDGPADSTWVDKIPTPVLYRIATELSEIMSAHVPDTELYYPWSLLKDHLVSCQLYLSSRDILLRPLIPPTWTLKAFENAKQRVYMSATLGGGGDLERLTGRRKIHRLPIPDGFQLNGVGRRFFIFPGMSLEPAQSEALRLDLMKIAGRSLVLTPSDAAGIGIADDIEKHLKFPIFDASDIEVSKDAFVTEKNAVAVMANRYDGIDFPKEECRLLCVDGLPRATNSQERFLMEKMGANILYNERVQTRVLQAVGRCTRSLEDYSAVYVTGAELLDYLANARLRDFFHPEVQAEIAFGLEQSKDVSRGGFIENFEMFLENGEAWAAANEQIVAGASAAVQQPFPAMDDLATAVGHEIEYQQAMWQGDFASAMDAAQNVLAELRHPDLRGYRALWYYLAGSAAFLGSQRGISGLDLKARALFAEAKKSTRMLPWLVGLGGETTKTDEELADQDLRHQVEQIERTLTQLGLVQNRAFAKLEKEVLEGLAGAEGFENAHRKLGELLGFTAGKVEADGSPDPWWLSKEVCFVFEDHAGALSTSALSAEKARQAAGHPKWMATNVPGSKGLRMISTLVSPVSEATLGAAPHLEGFCYWELDDFRGWAVDALATIRELRMTLNPPGDLVWRANAATALVAKGLTAKAIEQRMVASPAAEKLKIRRKGS